MSLATNLERWLRTHRNAEGTAPVLPRPGEPGGVRVDLAPVELGDGDRRAVGITVSPGRPSREFFGGGIFEHDLDVYLIGRTENDAPGTADAELQGVACMEPALVGLDSFSGDLTGPPPPGGEAVPPTRVLSCTLDATAITSDEDLRTVTGTFEYLVIVRS